MIGGYTCTLWIGIFALFENYESFKFTNSLIGNIYASTRHGPDAPPAETKENADKIFSQTLSRNTNNWYTYFELQMAWFLSTCCCCLTKAGFWRERLDRY